MPKCSGAVRLHEGDATALRCELWYDADRPIDVVWLDHAGSPVESTESDRSVSGSLAHIVRRLSLRAGWAMDRQQYRCRATIGDTVEECNLTMHVECKQ